MADNKKSGPKDDDGLTILERVQAICLKEGCPEPDEFLASVMTGVDPRFDASPLYHLVCEIVKARGDELPSEDEWAQVKNYVLQDPAYRPQRVELDVSIRAGDKLLDRLYPKLKAVEVTGEHIQRTVPQLTEHEIAAYKRTLDDEY